MDILYTTSATAVGGRDGHVRNADGRIDMNLKTPGTMGGEGGGTTPEDLFASGYAACFNGALNMAMRLKRIKAEGEVSVKVEVTLGKTPEGNFQLAARIDATVPGIEEEVARELLEDAHNICPYSRAIRGNVDVDMHVMVM